MSFQEIVEIVGFVVIVLVGLSCFGWIISITERLLSEKARARWSFFFNSLLILWFVSRCSSSPPHI